MRRGKEAHWDFLLAMMDDPTDVAHLWSTAGWLQLRCGELLRGGMVLVRDASQAQAMKVQLCPGCAAGDVPAERANKR